MALDRARRTLQNLNIRQTSDPGRWKLSPLPPNLITIDLILRIILTSNELIFAIDSQEISLTTEAKLERHCTCRRRLTLRRKAQGPRHVGSDVQLLGAETCRVVVGGESEAVGGESDDEGLGVDLFGYVANEGGVCAANSFSIHGFDRAGVEQCFNLPLA